MNLENVDKPAKGKNRAKYLLVRQDLSDKTIGAKGMKTKVSKETIRVFWLSLQKKVKPGKFGSTGEQNLLRSFTTCAKLEEYKSTLQWVRLKQHLLSVQYDPWKNILQLDGS